MGSHGYTSGIVADDMIPAPVQKGKFWLKDYTTSYDNSVHEVYKYQYDNTEGYWWCMMFL